jgi:hypothetical protein
MKRTNYKFHSVSACEYFRMLENSRDITESKLLGGGGGGGSGVGYKGKGFEGSKKLIKGKALCFQVGLTISPAPPGVVFFFKF